MSRGKLYFLLFCVLGVILFPFLSSPAHAVAPDNYEWVQHAEGISGSSVVGAVIDPTDGNTVYALTSGTGVYKTTDGGANWTAINSGLSTLLVAGSHLYGNLLTMDPNNHNTLYANFNGQPYKTTNGGTSWSLIATGIPDCLGTNVVVGVVVDPTNSNHLFSGIVTSDCAGGVYESTNQGASWTHVQESGGANDMYPLALDPADTSKMYVSTVHEENFRSTDGGHNWSSMSFPTPYGATDGTQIIVHPTNHTVFAANANGLLKSADYGVTWTAISTFAGTGVSSIAFAPSNSSIIYVVTGDGKIYKSTDTGANWTLKSTSSGIDWSTVAINATNSGTLFLASRGNGMYTSTDSGATVTQVNNGIPTSVGGRSTAIAPSNPNIWYSVVTGVGFYKSTDRGVNWTQMSTDSDVYFSFAIAVDPTDPNTIYSGIFDVQKSTDGGANWTSVLAPSSGIFRSMTIDPNNHLVVFAPDSGNGVMYKSTDGGTSWSQKASFTPATPYVFERINVDPRDSTRVYCATYNYIWRSTDSGNTWAISSSGISGDSNDWVDDVEIDPTNDNIVYATTRGGQFYRSTDYGATWTNTNYSSYASGDAANRIIIDETTPTTIYGFGGTLLKSTNSGSTWAAVDISAFNTANLKFTAREDPEEPKRIIGGDLVEGFLIYENYIPLFDQSTFTAANHNGSSSYRPGDTIDFTLNVKNTGFAPGTNPSAKIVFPNSGITYVSSSAKSDGVTISPDPISGKTLTMNPIDLTYQQSVPLTFQATIDQNASGTVTVDPTITSNEDISGTTIADLTFNISSNGGSGSGSGSGSGGNYNPNCYPFWVFCIDAGPHFTGLTNFISGHSGAVGAKVMIGNSATHDDLYVTVDRRSPDYLAGLKKPVLFPWQQGLNVASEIYEIRAYSAFNGFKINQIDFPFTVSLNYDSTKLLRRTPSSLKIAIFDETKRRWSVLTSKNVVNLFDKTIINTTKLFSYFALVFSSGGGTVGTSPKPATQPSTAPVKNEEPINPNVENLNIQTKPIPAKSSKLCVLWWCF